MTKRKGSRVKKLLCTVLALTLLFTILPVNSMTVYAMQIYINISDGGDTFSLDVEPTDMVEDLKGRIEEIKSIPHSRQKLTFAGRELEDGNQLQDYSIQRGNTIVVTEIADTNVVKNAATGATYATLQEAFDAVADNQTIELLADVTLPSKTTFSGNKNVTLDGKGFSIIGDGENKGLAMQNYAKLTMKNVTYDGNNKKYYESSYGKGVGGFLTLDDNCQLTLSNGATIKNADILGDDSSAQGVHSIIALNNKSSITMEEGSQLSNIYGHMGVVRLNRGSIFKMNGGTVTGCKTRDDYVTQHSSYHEGVLIYLADGYGNGSGSDLDTVNPATFIMNGGVITDCGTENNAVSYGLIYMHPWCCAKVEITGGKIQNCSAYRGGAVYSNPYSGITHSINVSGSVIATTNRGTDSSINALSNFYLGDRSLINITGALTGDGLIGVWTESLPTDTADIKIAEYSAGYSGAPQDAAHVISDNPSSADILYCDGTKDYDKEGNEVSTAHHTHAKGLWLSTTVAIYTVTFDANGHGTAPDSKTVINGKKVSKPTDPAATGFAFEGWYKEAGCTNAWNFDTDGVSENTTLYAKWTIVPYTITYTLNGGTVENANPATYNVETETFALNNPTKADYVFEGWTGSNGTTAQTSVSIAKGSTGDKEYTANWVAKSVQTISAEDVVATVGDTGKSVSATTNGDGTLSYAIKSGSATDVVSVDSATGALTILKAGSTIVTVTASETSTYASAVKDVNITINVRKLTPVGSDFNYNTKNGVVSAAEGKDLGTVTTYYKVNGAWTTTKPTAPGNYEVGVVTTESDTYYAAGSASNPFTNNWTYIVKKHAPAHTHTFETTWSKDATYHWHASTCGHTTEVSEKAVHTFGAWTSNNDATATTAGTKSRVCNVCGYRQTVKDEGSQKSNEGKTPEADDKKIDSDDDKNPLDAEIGDFVVDGIGNTAEEVKAAVLTEEDLAAIAEGSDVNVWIEIVDISDTVPAEDKEIIEKEMPTDYTLGVYLDVSLWKRIAGGEAFKITETLNGKIKVEFEIPEELQQAGRTYKIIRIHDGKATIIDVEVDSEYKASFETDQFSTYALIYEEKVSASPSEDNQVMENEELPEQEATNSYWLWILVLMAILAMILLILFYIKRRKEEQE